MRSSTAQLDAPIPETLRERCAEMGWAAWRFSSATQLISGPDLEGPAGAWFCSPMIEGLVERRVALWAAQEDPEAGELFEGCWLIPLIDTHRRRRTAYNAVMLLEPRALRGEYFLAACDSAGLDAEATRSAMREIAWCDRETVWRAERMLRWFRDDLRGVEVAQGELSTFGRQLTETYEELSLLYTLSGSMNELANPEKFLRTVCEELNDTLPFRWIGAYFVDDRARARDMSGRVFTAGDMPCGPGEFARAAGAILVERAPERGLVLEASERGVLGRSDAQLIVQPILLDGRMLGGLFAGDKEGLDPQVSTMDLKLIGTAAGHAAVLLGNAFLYGDQQRNFLGTLRALTGSIDAKDPYTCGHSERVAMLSASLARALGLEEHEVELIRVAGMLHDIGKIGVPESVLCKPGRLTDEEFEQIKLHPRIGYDILRGVPALEGVLPGVLHHHERFDGRGYPSGLSGEEIPLMARVIGTVDAFDAMSSTRTYRGAMERDRVLGELRKNAGAQFDPALVEAFLTIDLGAYDDAVSRHHAMSLEGGLRVGRRSNAA